MYRRVRIEDPDHGPQQYGRVLSHRYGIQWEEYWPFLLTMCDLSSSYGLDLLNRHLETKAFVYGTESSPAGMSWGGAVHDWLLSG